MRWLLAVVATGCGFTHGTVAADARDVDAADAASDGLVDAPPPATCYEQWLAGTIRFDTPVALTELNTSGYERDPFLPADELTIYFSSARPDDYDVWVATRTTLAAPFTTPVPAYEFNSFAEESKLSIAANNKIAVVGSNRPGSEKLDVWESIRTDTTTQWPAMNRTNVAMVDTSGNEHDPTICADGNHLYLAPDTGSSQHIALATRGNDGKFGAPVELQQLTSGSGDADPSPTPDERILVYTSGAATSGAGGGDLWYTTRAAATDPFGPPHAVPDINTTGAEGDPHLSADGCRIYFARNIAGNDWDLYLATALP